MKTPRYRLLGILGLIVMICSLFVYFQLRDLPFFRKKLMLTAQFDQISSLTEGADVRFAGMQLGKVQSISFDKKTKKILVTLMSDQVFIYLNQPGHWLIFPVYCMLLNWILYSRKANMMRF